MSLPELIRKLVEKKIGSYCEQKIPEGVRDKVRAAYRVRGNAVTIFEQRPTFGKPEKWVDIPVAQLRYDEATKKWELYCADRNGRWHDYLYVEATPDVDKLLQEIDEDPTGIFWG